MDEDRLLAAIEERRNDAEFMGRLRSTIERLGIPIGTDDPDLIAAGATPLLAEHQCRYPRPNDQGFPVNQCLDCGGWFIAEPDTYPSPAASAPKEADRG